MPYETNPQRSDGDVRLLVVPLLPKLRTFALGLTRSPDRADDLVQEAVERAIRNARQWTPGTRLDSWLYRIVQNCWISEARRQSVRRRWNEGRAAEPVAVLDGPGNADDRLVLRHAMAAFLELPVTLRATAALVILQGETYQQASETLGVPVGTVMSRVARARQALRAACADIEPSASPIPRAA